MAALALFKSYRTYYSNNKRNLKKSQDRLAILFIFFQKVCVGGRGR
jgi:hypothetical protein